MALVAEVWLMIVSLHTAVNGREKLYMLYTSLVGLLSMAERNCMCYIPVW